MPVGHVFEVCRALYQTARRGGSPVVHIVDLGGGYYCGETDDGKVLTEGTTGCCKWAMKYDVAREWLTEKNA